MAQGRGRGQTLPAWMTQGGNDAALDSMLASASQAAAQRERPGGDEPAPKRRSRFDDGPPQQPPPPQGGGWGAPPPANGGWGAPPPQGGWGQPPPQAGGGWGAAAPQEDPRIAAAKRAAAAFSSGAAAPPATGGRGRGLTTPAWMSQAPAAAAPPTKPTSPRANDPRARNKAPAMPTAPPMPSSAPPPRDAWDGVGAPPPVPLPPAPPPAAAFTGSDAARKALERMGAAPPAPPPASNPEDAEKAARARIKEMQNAGTDDYQKKDFQAALTSYKSALQLLDDLKRDVPATSSRVNAERDERRMKVLSCVAKAHEKLGNAQEAKDASRACDKIQKRLSEYKRRARK